MKPDIKLYLVLLIFGIVGCQKSSDNKDKLSQLLLLGATSRSTLIPQTEGGTVTSTDQAVTMSLTVPQGALEEDTTITYTPIDVPEGKDSVVPLQAAFSFGPENLQFNKPATMKLCYDVMDLQERGLTEKTIQVQYYNPETGEFVSMGGDVDFSNHCVSAEIYHFSTYVLTAQILSLSNNPPTIGGASFFPGRPLAGLPLTVRSVVNDWDGGSAIASVRFFYRNTGSGSVFKSVAMKPDANDGTGQYYKVRLPGSEVTAAGLEYYVEAYDSLNSHDSQPTGAPGSYNTIAADLPAATNPIRFQTTVTQMSAGFSRDLTVQVKGQSAATYYPVPADTLTFGGNQGDVSRPTWLSARYTARIAGTSNLQATYGSLNHSSPVTIYPGLLERLVVLYNDTQLPTPFVVNSGSTTQLDVAGYDAYQNFMFVQPNFTASGGIGTFGDSVNYGKFTAAMVSTDQDGTITATLGGFSVTYYLRVLQSPLSTCQFETGLFDRFCIYN